jgi:hypothetical protein
VKRKPVKPLNNQLVALIMAGQQLSNCAYNLAQRDHLTPRERKSLDDAHQNRRKGNSMSKPKITRAYLTRKGPVDDAFRKLSPAKKRVAVATDALRWLKSGAAVGVCGTYIEPTRMVPWDKTKEVDAVEPVGIAALVAARCEVCAKGALFLATVMRTNQLGADDVLLSRAEDMHSKVCDTEAIFSDRAFDRIESVFEGSAGEWATVNSAWNELYPRAHGGPWGNLDPGPSQDLRLKAILVNIIVNNGTFRPAKVPSRAEVKRWLAKV